MATLALLIYITAGALLVVLQATGLELIKIFGVKPDLILPFVVWISLKEDENIAQSVGFFVGLIEDSLSGTPLGTFAFTKTIIARATFLIPRSVREMSPIVPFLFVPIATLLEAVMLLPLQLAFAGNINLVHFLKICAILPIYNLLFSPLLKELVDGLG